MNFIKKYKWYLFSFIFPLIVLVIFFAFMGCFGEKNILNSDMQGQYVSLFQYLKNVLNGDATFPYTFSKGLGGSMYGAFFYYLSNPLNFLVYFVKDIPFFLMLLVILKLSLCGLTMNIFLSSKYKKNNITLLIFSIIYVFIGFNINYHTNLMWLDGVIFAPIILLGIDRMIQYKSNWLFIIFLFFTILCNYYIGYILCLFSVIYFLYSLFLKYNYKNDKKEMKKLTINFLIVLLLTGLLTSIILIPSGLELLNTQRVFSLKSEAIINWNFFDYIASLYIGFGNFMNPLNYFGFNIYSSILMIPLVLLYFKNSKFSRKEKKITALVYLVLLVPVTINLMNYLWHMFTIPIAFNYRFSFLVSLFTIYIALKSYLNLEIHKKSLCVLLIISIILSSSLLFLINSVPHYYVYLSSYKIILSIVILSMYVFLLIKGYKKILIFLSIFEVILNLGIIGYGSTMFNSKAYLEGVERSKILSSYCDNNLVRCDDKEAFSWNSSFLGNYNSISNFLTTTNGSTIKFLYNISGVENSANHFFYSAINPIMDMILGTKYIITDKETNIYFEKINWKSTDNNGSIINNYLLENSRALSFGYVVSNNIKDFKYSNLGIKYQEQLLNSMIGDEKEYFVKLKVEKKNNNLYNAFINTDSPYIYIVSDVTPKINGEEMNYYDYVYVADYYGILYNTYENDYITLEFDKEPEKVEIYYLNLKVLNEFYEKVSTNQIKITEKTGNYLKGNITSDKDGVLFLTIPFENGWRVKVDGEFVEHFKLIDSFIGIDIVKGEHIIEFEYEIPGFKIGLLTSILSLFGLIAYELYIKSYVMR